MNEERRAAYSKQPSDEQVHPPRPDGYTRVIIRIEDGEFGAEQPVLIDIPKVLLDRLSDMVVRRMSGSSVLWALVERVFRRP